MGATTFSIMTLNIIAFSIMTLNIIAFRIISLIIKGLFVALSVNDILHKRHSA
jgi:hypothetical protein